MRRAALVLLVLAGALAAPADAQSPAFVKDSAEDGRGALDVVRVALGRAVEGRLLGEVTMEKAWTTANLRAGAGPSGSICLQLYTARTAGAEPPDYLVCASPAATGEELRGRVLRDRSNGLPRQVGVATVTRPTARTIYLRFAQSAIDLPATVNFAAEAVTRARGCPRPLGCRDTAPNAPATGDLTLRGTSPSG